MERLAGADNYYRNQMFDNIAIDPQIDILVSFYIFFWYRKSRKDFGKETDAGTTKERGGPHSETD